MPTQTTSAADTARAVLDAFNTRDPKQMRKLWSDDCVERMPDQTLDGPDALEASFSELFAALPDAHMEVKAVAEDGDTALVRWQLTGTHQGIFQGVKPTGKSITLDGIDHMTIRDGKLAHNFVVFDRQQFAQQLGMMPPDGSAAERGMKAMFNAGTALKARLAKRR